MVNNRLWVVCYVWVLVFKQTKCNKVKLNYLFLFCENLYTLRFKIHYLLSTVKKERQKLKILRK